MSTSTLTNPGSGGLYRSTHSRSSVKRTLLLCGAQRNPVWNNGVWYPFLRGQHYSTGQRCVKVAAGWLFKGGGADKSLEASIEFSESANEDILVFFFQLDLATRVQYALNLDQFDIAQQLRNKLTEVEEEVTRQRNAKKGSSAKTEVQDQAIRILRLRAELQSAIDTENYAVAAELRDGIAKLEAESLEASAKALAYGKVQFAFRLGQKLRHKIFGYRGVICGMDPVCCESNDWMETANVQSLSKGSNQPFYQVLVDVREDADLLVTYVAEENLIAPEKPDLTRFDHPYTSFLFYGVDSAGDFIPIKQLREKYNQPRYEVPSDPEDEEDGDRP
ncbi:clp protease adapter protein ClpF, chloroplastic [Silene latifolia]|uniref:clp protease adapter protein ClpF, chloroplastic n=1 Tax=Silene latifolia TaxID=37657 RepID=UPI003D77D7B1